MTYELFSVKIDMVCGQNISRIYYWNHFSVWFDEYFIFENNEIFKEIDIIWTK